MIYEILAHRKKYINFILSILFGSSFFILIAYINLSINNSPITPQKFMIIPMLIGGTLGLIINIIYHQNINLKTMSDKLRIYEMITMVAPSGIFVVDTNHVVQIWNKKAEEITGFTAEDIVGKECYFKQMLLCKEGCFFKFDKMDEVSLSKECDLLTKSGKEIIIHKQIVYLKNPKNEVVGGIEIFTDITDKKEAEKILEYRATTDMMTGVYNRATGLVILEKQIQISARRKESLTICFVDVNNLKMVNDKFGHSEGDNLINETCSLLKSCIRESDTICRIGGDEFLLILPGSTAEQVDHKWNSGVFEKIRETNRTPGRKYVLSLSHGTAEYNQLVELDVDDLVALADKRMYEEKMRIKNKSLKLA